MKKSSLYVIGFLSIAIAAMSFFPSNQRVEESEVQVAKTSRTEHKIKQLDSVEPLPEPLIETEKNEKRAIPARINRRQSQKRTLASIDTQNLSNIETSSLKQAFQANYYSFHKRRDFSWSDRIKLSKVIAELSRRFPDDAEIAKAQLDPIAAESIDELNDHLMENFDKASEFNPNDHDLLSVEMYLAVINEDPNLESHLEAYSQKYPDDIDGDIYLAGLYYKQGRTRQARDSFFAAYAKNPQDPMVLSNKGFVLGQHSTLGLLRFGDKIYTQAISFELDGSQ